MSHKNAYNFPEKTFIMMVGLPGSGKDYFIDNELIPNVSGDWVVLGTDKIIEEYMAEHNVTYNEAFNALNSKDVNKSFQEKMAAAFDDGLCVIHNQTNVAAKSRRKKLKSVPNDYYKVAVYITVSDDIHQKQLDEREGKTIPEYVMKQMKDGFTAPDKYSEGWDKIIKIER